MPRATWNGAVIADAPESECQIVEGNVYFPPGAVDQTLLKGSETHTACHWKGQASYYDVVVGGAVNRDAAWYYPQPLPEAAHIAGFVAFWRGVEVTR